MSVSHPNSTHGGPYRLGKRHPTCPEIPRNTEIFLPPKCMKRMKRTQIHPKSPGIAEKVG